ncbi:MAG TPA: superoxide dismutase family protein [Niabella sp.]|jgi:Cu-Zn family superoxide dismutase|nr:superoxide dismutase family protein [Chitinophagaceae bacterium]HRN47614.1 superoxide dismutase family protein [Niabella sp.]HRO86142.1 superoxide dismutase family protein [Niabella sp.]HUN03848.1 superoxide dismutase family protein [Niabella sp.]
MKFFLFLLLPGFLALSSCGSSSKINTKNLIASAQLQSTANTAINVGSADFYLQKDGQIAMVMKINIKEKANSSVAVHFHEHGDCGNKGDNTHGHWNPTKENHGQWGNPPFHSGDIGNISLDKNGNGKVVITTDRWSVKEGNINNIIGRGIIVHGGVDDYKTQPTGNSGPRIGCGVIEKR